MSEDYFLPQDPHQSRKSEIDRLIKILFNYEYECDITLLPKTLDTRNIVKGYRLKIKNKYGLVIKRKTYKKLITNYNKSWYIDKYNLNVTGDIILMDLMIELTKFIANKKYKKEYKQIQDKIKAIKTLYKEFNLDYDLVAIFVGYSPTQLFQILHRPNNTTSYVQCDTDLDCLLSQCKIDLYREDLVELRKKVKQDEQELFND